MVAAWEMLAKQSKSLIKARYLNLAPANEPPAAVGLAKLHIRGSLTRLVCVSCFNDVASH